MRELKCPKCGSVFSVDEADYAFIMQQVKTAEFDAEVERRLAEVRRHDDAKKAEYFIKRKVDEQEKSTEIYLTAEEVNALYNMKLTGLQEQCRDMFIVGCCTCQRVSDYTSLSEDNFTTTAKGTPVVRLKQKKTGKVVTIPILDGKLKAIAEKLWLL